MYIYIGLTRVIFYFQVRVGTREDPTLLYRWTASSMTSTVDRRTLLAVRAAAFERRVLSGTLEHL